MKRKRKDVLFFAGYRGFNDAIYQHMLESAYEILKDPEYQEVFLEYTKKLCELFIKGAERRLAKLRKRRRK
jgi:Fe-S oxidoreductase